MKSKKKRRSLLDAEEDLAVARAQIRSGTRRNPADAPGRSCTTNSHRAPFMADGWNGHRCEPGCLQPTIHAPAAFKLCVTYYARYGRLPKTADLIWGPEKPRDLLRACTKARRQKEP